MKWFTPRFLAIVISAIITCYLLIGVLIDVQRIKINQRYEQLVEKRGELNRQYGEELNRLHDLVDQSERHLKIQE
ncbi:hypothetical protein P7H16_01800 [Paenibacillus larvae]|nr:hypothetical protein [Paenibacillus larvae]MDT2246003.1 hypothetical protein [Paenibacillus larvae]MDT2259612.1 hypothetical protein [Paenibacillus larvae]MDT2275124.1 hypothetical protein [Paenibacillus larvae]